VPPPREREICASPTGIRAISRLGGPDVVVKIRDTIEARRAGK
jgi:hypothetical protein